MVKKTAKPQSNVEEKKKRKCRLLEEYYNYTLLDKTILTNSTLDRFAQDIVQWASANEDAIKINQFLALKGVAYSTWGEWCSKYPILQEAHDHAKLIIGNRREIGLMTRKFEANSTSMMMPLYDVDWKKIVEWKTNLNKKEEPETGTKYIFVEKIPDSPLVPKKKDKDGN